MTTTAAAAFGAHLQDAAAAAAAAAAAGASAPTSRGSGGGGCGCGRMPLESESEDVGVTFEGEAKQLHLAAAVMMLTFACPKLWRNLGSFEPVQVPNRDTSACRQWRANF